MVSSKIGTTVCQALDIMATLNFHWWAGTWRRYLFNHIMSQLEIFKILLSVRCVHSLFYHSEFESTTITGLRQTKPVFGVSDKARLKPVSSATETS